MLEKYSVAHSSLCHGFNNSGSLSELKEVTHRACLAQQLAYGRPSPEGRCVWQDCFTRLPGFLTLTHVYIPPTSWHISFFIGSMNVGFVSIFSFVILLSLISFHLELYRERFTKWLIWIVTAETTTRWFYSHLGPWPHPNLPPHGPHLRLRANTWSLVGACHSSDLGSECSRSRDLWPLLVRFL